MKTHLMVILSCFSLTLYGQSNTSDIIGTWQGVEEVEFHIDPLHLNVSIPYTIEFKPNGSYHFNVLYLENPVLRRLFKVYVKIREGSYRLPLASQKVQKLRLYSACRCKGIREKSKKAIEESMRDIRILYLDQERMDLKIRLADGSFYTARLHKR